jgi:phage terminase large subunit-like protein
MATESVNSKQSQFPGAYFDQSKVDEVIQFIESLTLTKCTLSGQPEPFLVLDHWRDPITNIYGWRRPDGTRVVRKAYISFGRKQAKTQGAAGIAAYEFFMGDEPRQEIYFAASSADQASICFSAVADMIRVDEELESICRITDSIKKSVNFVNGNLLKVLSADGKKQHGLNPSLSIKDEYHCWGPPEEELDTALNTGSKSRRQPLQLIITTAGTDQESLCGREYEYARKVMAGTIIDPTYLAYIHEVPREAEWTDKSLWPLALPLLRTGHHKLSDYEEEFSQALQRPDKQNEFRRLYLNQWTSAETQWIPLQNWDECVAHVSDEELDGADCWAGLDLGSTGDFTAFSLVFRLSDGRIVLRCWCYVPDETLDERQRRDGINYRYWVERGWMRTTGGKTTDQGEVFRHIAELHDRYQIKTLAFDRWRAKYIAEKCEEIGIEMMEFGQGYASMSPAIERFEDLVYNHRIMQDGNLCLRWNMDCAQVMNDPAGNKKIVKPKTHQKQKHVDAAVSSVMGVAAMCLAEVVDDPYSKGHSAVVV